LNRKKLGACLTVAVVAVGAVLALGIFNQTINRATPQRNNSNSSRYETPPSEWHSPPKTVIGEGSGVESASYVVFGRDTDGDNVAEEIYTKSGDTGKIMFSGADAATVMEKTIENIPHGRSGSIFVKAGTYPFQDNLVIDGENHPGLSIVGVSGPLRGKGTIFDFQGKCGIRIENHAGIKLEGLCLKSTSGGTPPYGIEFEDVDFGMSVLERVIITGDFQRALYAKNAYSGNGVRVEQCKIVAKENCPAVILEDASQWDFSDTWIWGAGATGVAQHGVKVRNGSKPKTEQISFYNCHIHHLGGDAFNVDADKFRSVSLVATFIELCRNAFHFLSDSDSEIRHVSGRAGGLSENYFKAPAGSTGIELSVINVGYKRRNDLGDNLGDNPIHVQSGRNFEPNDIVLRNSQWFKALSSSGDERTLFTLDADNNLRFIGYHYTDFKEPIRLLGDASINAKGQTIHSVGELRADNAYADNLMIENMYDLDPQTSAPAGAEAGTVAMSDGTNWDVDGDGYAELAIYNGSSWLVLENMRTTY